MNSCPPSTKSQNHRSPRPRLDAADHVSLAASGPGSLAATPRQAMRQAGGDGESRPRRRARPTALQRLLAHPRSRRRRTQRGCRPSAAPPAGDCGPCSRRPGPRTGAGRGRPRRRARPRRRGRRGAPPRGERAQAPVDVLVVHEERLVRGALLQDELRPHQRGAAGDEPGRIGGRRPGPRSSGGCSDCAVSRRRRRTRGRVRRRTR